MKIVCTQENLNKALQAVGRIPKKDSTLPILNNILIEASHGNIVLKATDLEIGISIILRGKIEKEGTVTVPANLLSEYVATLPRQNVELEVKEESVTVTCGTFSSTLLGMKHDDFPLIPKVEEGAKIKVSAGLFKTQIAQVISFTALDEMRPEIAGVHFEMDKNTLILAATDGHRLAEAKIVVESGALQNPIILPRQTLLEVLRILGTDGDIEITISENQVAFSYNDIILVSRLIDGNYPPYRELVPADFQTEVDFQKSELISSLRATSLFGKHNVQDINMEIQKNEVKLSSQASQVGESHASLPVKQKGIANTITFNARYLLEGLANFTTDEVKLVLNSSTEPAILRNEKASYFYLIMPIKH
jgi:DNA polymerase-3 subunit beta